MAALITC